MEMMEGTTDTSFHYFYHASLRKEGFLKLMLEVTVHHGREVMEQEHEMDGHIASAVRKQREILTVN